MHLMKLSCLYAAVYHCILAVSAVWAVWVKATYKAADSAELGSDIIACASGSWPLHVLLLV